MGAPLFEPFVWLQPSVEPAPSRNIGLRGGSKAGSASRSFALAVEPIELVETRRELLREAQLWLTRWEQSRDAEARGRLLQSLDVLAMLVRRDR